MFRFRLATSNEDLEKAHRLRYQVYCIERQFEDPTDHPGGLERDDFDDDSWHFLCLDEDETAVGTVRLIRATDRPLPIETHCEIEYPINPTLRPHTAEISRMAISRDYRRRAGDTIYGVTDANTVKAPPPGIDRRQLPLLFMGLLREMYRTSLKEGISHWYAAMERRLALLIRRYSFDFRPIGPAVSYHGIRIPHAVAIGEMESRVRDCREDVYDYFREGLDPTLLAWTPDTVAL